MKTTSTRSHLGGYGEGLVHVTCGAEVAHEIVAEPVVFTQDGVHLLTTASAPIILAAQHSAATEKKGGLYTWIHKPPNI